MTHRAVAAGAAESLSAIRYYFATRDDLLLACIEETERQRAAAAITLIDAARNASGPSEVAALILEAYYGPDVTDDSLRGTVTFVIDSSREVPIVAERLRQMRQRIDVGINDQLGAVLVAAGYGHLAPSLAAAVLDGSILVSTVEREPDITARAIRDLAAILRFARSTPDDGSTTPSDGSAGRVP